MADQNAAADAKRVAKRVGAKAAAAFAKFVAADAKRVANVKAAADAKRVADEKSTADTISKRVADEKAAEKYPITLREQNAELRPLLQAKEAAAADSAKQAVAALIAAEQKAKAAEVGRPEPATALSEAAWVPDEIRAACIGCRTMFGHWPFPPQAPLPLLRRSVLLQMHGKISYHLSRCSAPRLRNLRYKKVQI